MPRKPKKPPEDQAEIKQPASLPGQKGLWEQTPAEKLAATCGAVRVRFSQMGRERQLSHEHKAELALALRAEEQSLSASKKLLDSKEPAVRNVSRAKSAIESLLEGLYPYPEPGIRLIRQEDIPNWQASMDRLIGEFHKAEAELADAMPEVKRRQRARLGRAYDETDYPDDVRQSFNVYYEFVNLRPPEYLNPELKEREERRMMARYAEAAQLAEQALVNELHAILEQLVSSLQGVTAGTQKTFKSSVVENLYGALESFQSRLAPMGIGREGALKTAVEDLQKVLTNQTIETLPGALRSSVPLREDISAKLQTVGQELAKHIVTAPIQRRRLSRETPVAVAG